MHTSSHPFYYNLARLEHATGRYVFWIVLVGRSFNSPRQRLPLRKKYVQSSPRCNPDCKEHDRGVKAITWMWEKLGRSSRIFPAWILSSMRKSNFNFFERSALHYARNSNCKFEQSWLWLGANSVKLPDHFFREKHRIALRFSPQCFKCFVAAVRISWLPTICWVILAKMSIMWK